MKIRSARRIPRETLPANLAPIGTGPDPAPRKARLVLRPELEAEARAKTIVERAENEARAILDQAERAASGVRLIAEAEGRANGAASMVGTRAQTDAMKPFMSAEPRPNSRSSRTLAWNGSRVHSCPSTGTTSV